MRFSLFKSLCFSVLMSVTAGVWAAAPISLAEASKIYSENCAVCHGDRGDGQSRARFGLTPQPRDFTSPGAAAELNRKRMITSVVQGREGTAMVGWHGRLSMPEIEGVVNYIRTTFMRLAPSEEELAVTEPRLQHGKALYEEHCRVCHGDRGNGATWTNSVLNPPPRNFTSPQARRILTRKRMLASVTYGRKQTAMIAFSNRLSEGDIADVVDYVRATFMKGDVVADAGMVDLSDSGALGGHGGANGTAAPHGRAPASIGTHGMAPRLAQQQPAGHAVDMDAPFPAGLKSDFKRGREIYMANCTACHGVRGDGLGSRAYFIQPKPRNFLHIESRSMFNRPALFQAIMMGKAGTVMPAWGTVLSPQQVADVAEFVYQDFIHPNPDEIEPQPEPEQALEEDKKKAPWR